MSSGHNFIVKRKAILRRLLLLCNSVFLSACSGLSPYSSVTPVDQALKACGLGYSAEASAVFRGAFQYAEADNSKGIDFSAKMQDSLNTQVSAILSTKEVAGRMESKDLAAVILSTQACVIKLADAYRPKSRSDVVNACIEDLQKRVSGAGSSQSTDSIRNWNVDSESKTGDVERLKVSAVVHSFANNNNPVSFYCLARNGSYEDIEIIKEN